MNKVNINVRYWLVSGRVLAPLTPKFGTHIRETGFCKGPEIIWRPLPAYKSGRLPTQGGCATLLALDPQPWFLVEPFPVMHGKGLGKGHGG